ncbi:MAG: hypothetical protein KDJ29_13355 [Hyphomicrobiales bacterium]|nr:hypothetical protein [Hyphomicrobiales bacterium]
MIRLSVLARFLKANLRPLFSKTLEHRAKNGVPFVAHNDTLFFGTDQLLRLQLNRSEGTLIDSGIRPATGGGRQDTFWCWFVRWSRMVRRSIEQKSRFCALTRLQASGKTVLI